MKKTVNLSKILTCALDLVYQRTTTEPSRAHCEHRNLGIPFFLLDQQKLMDHSLCYQQPMKSLQLYLRPTVHSKGMWYVTLNLDTYNVFRIHNLIMIL
jgi:hypothetical protein